MVKARTLLVIGSLALAGVVGIAALGANLPDQPPGDRAKAACDRAYPGDDEGAKGCQLRLLVGYLDAQQSAKAAQAARDFQ